MSYVMSGGHTHQANSKREDRVREAAWFSCISVFNNYFIFRPTAVTFTPPESAYDEQPRYFGCMLPRQPVDIKKWIQLRVLFDRKRFFGSQRVREYQASRADKIAGRTMTKKHVRGMRIVTVTFAPIGIA